MATIHALGGDRRRSLRALLASLVATAALAAATAGFTVGVTTAGAQVDGPESADTAASWLAGQFIDGQRFETTSGSDVFPDYGLTIDAVFALASAGVADGTAAAAVDWLETSESTAGYIGTPDTFAGSVAKLAVLAQVRGLDPTSWGEDGLDLIGILQGREQPNGRFTDDSSFGDFSNSITQSFAIIALHRHPATTPSDASLDLLLASQCPDGGFALELEPAAGTCTSGVDTTAYALQALLAVNRPADATAIADAEAYLLDAQQAGGGFATAATGTPNANSTGLGGQALGVAGEELPAIAAALFLNSLQQRCDAPADVRGAIDFDGGEFDASNAARATSQGILGLGGPGLAELSAAGATDDRPTLDCPAGGGPDDDLPSAPAAVPVQATPTFTG
jgi:hypothetical protein